MLLLGLGLLLLGGIGYGGFRLIGFEGFSAGIASQAILVLLVVVWTGSYLFRVLNGKMTFNEQRKRYREAYEKITKADLQARFESMSEEEQARLLQELAKEDESFDNSPDR